MKILTVVQLPSRLEFLLVILCLLFSGGMYYTGTKSDTQIAQAEFRRITEDNEQLLRTRLNTYLQGLSGAASFLKASEDIRAEEFDLYVHSLNIDKQLPGIGGIGLVVEVSDTDLDAFVAKRQAEGQSDFALRNVSDAQTHYIIKYIYPYERNAAALGLDLTFRPDRLRPLEYSRETGVPQMTPPLQLVQDAQKRSGFVIQYPILTTLDGSETGRKFHGWITAPFIADDMLGTIIRDEDPSFNLEVYVGAPTDGVMIFDSQIGANLIGEHSSTIEMDTLGHKWTLVYNSTKRFDDSPRSNQLINLVLIGLLIVGLIMLLRSMRVRSDALREIARLRAKENAVREDEYRSIVENDVASVMVINEAGKILFANQAVEACFGYDNEELTGMPFDQLCSEKDLTDRESCNAIGRTKTGDVLELDLQRNTWETLDNEIRTTVIIRNVTEQNKALHELSRNKTLYDLALQGSDIGVFDIDLLTGKSEVSDTWYRIMGYENDLDGLDAQQSFMERVHPDDLSILTDADRDCIAGLTERSVAEYRVSFGKDNWRWMHSNAVAVERDEDNTATRLIGTQSDVTELRRNRNALEASEMQFRQVVANAPIGMAVMDHNGKFVVVNNAFCHLVGVTQQSLETDTKLADLLPQDDIKMLEANIRQIIQDKSANVYTAEHRIKQPEGPDRWGLLNVSWTFDKNEGHYSFITQVIDITDKKKVDQIKDEFVSTVSHELRTPLTSIKGALALLNQSSDGKLSKVENRLVDIASTNADRLTDIVNDILDLEKISSGGVSFDLQRVGLRSLIKSTAHEMSPFAGTHSNTLRIDMPPEPISIFVDPGRTKQVLTNLISNACKYSSADSEVTIKSETIGDMAIIYIQNDGPGIPDSFRSHIFEAFSQADSSDTRAKGGTGLGLNISRQIVMRLGGQMGFESVPDGVTVFWFTVPLATADNETRLETSDEHNSANAKKVSLLHVENDVDFAEVIAGSLKHDAHVTNAQTIAKARHEIFTSKWDVILLDWGMPDGDADELLKDIVAQQPSADVISLSADGDRAKDPRVSESLTKSRNELAALVEVVQKIGRKVSLKKNLDTELGKTHL